MFGVNCRAAHGPIKPLISQRASQAYSAGGVEGRALGTGERQGGWDPAGNPGEAHPGSPAPREEGRRELVERRAELASRRRYNKLRTAPTGPLVRRLPNVHDLSCRDAGTPSGRTPIACTAAPRGASRHWRRVRAWLVREGREFAARRRAWPTGVRRTGVQSPWSIIDSPDILAPSSPAPSRRRSRASRRELDSAGPSFHEPPCPMPSHSLFSLPFSAWCVHVETTAVGASQHEFFPTFALRRTGV